MPAPSTHPAIVLNRSSIPESSLSDAGRNGASCMRPRRFLYARRGARPQAAGAAGPWRGFMPVILVIHRRESAWRDSPGHDSFRCGRDELPATGDRFPATARAEPGRSPSGGKAAEAKGRAADEAAARRKLRACPFADAKAAGFVKRPIRNPRSLRARRETRQATPDAVRAGLVRRKAGFRSARRHRRRSRSLRNRVRRELRAGPGFGPEPRSGEPPGLRPCRGASGETGMSARLAADPGSGDRTLGSIDTRNRPRGAPRLPGKGRPRTGQWGPAATSAPIIVGRLAATPSNRPLLALDRLISRKLAPIVAPGRGGADVLTQAAARRRRRRPKARVGAAGLSFIGPEVVDQRRSRHRRSAPCRRPDRRQRPLRPALPGRRPASSPATSSPTRRGSPGWSKARSAPALLVDRGERPDQGDVAYETISIAAGARDRGPARRAASAASARGRGGLLIATPVSDARGAPAANDASSPASRRRIAAD